MLHLEVFVLTASCARSNKTNHSDKAHKMGHVQAPRQKVTVRGTSVSTPIASCHHPQAPPTATSDTITSLY